MFKLYHNSNGAKIEILPSNNLYTVRELVDYEFVYEGKIPDKFQDLVFIEDIVVDTKWYDSVGNKIISKKNKFFQDYFGFASLTINGQLFKLNIQIEKFKLSEIEDILVYLWQNENKVFYNFFSKSTIKSKIDKDGAEFGLTSKFLHFANYFHDTFSELYLFFKKSPHTVLRTKNELVEYSPSNVSSNSIGWILSNLDNINFDNSFKGFPDAIKIKNQYGYIDKIETEQSFKSFNLYENQIILGSFANIITKLNNLKSEIKSIVNDEDFGDDKFVDFRDLKKIPFLKLFNDSNSVDIKISRLYYKYKSLFNNVLPKNETPRVTAIFSNKSHYRTAFKVIRESKELKFNFEGELQLLNIKKLSQLYEAYNLHRIIYSLSEKLNLNYFQKDIVSDREDYMPSKVSFSEADYSINIYYELRYPNNHKNTELVRIDTRSWRYYEPDYIIEITKKTDKSFYIIDSKYTKFNTLRNNHLPDCVYKYLLNTGIRNERYKKPEYLVLLYPGDEEEYMIRNEKFSPQVIMIPSKPKSENYLNEFINEIIEKELPATLYNQQTI